MTRLGKPVPKEIVRMRRTIKKYLTERRFKTIDASSEVTGKDFLAKIWTMIISVPLGIAVLDNDMSPQTLSNVFYEIGLLQALGKEIIIVKKGVEIPSDFIRTEYIEYDRGFKKQINKYLDKFLEQADYYETVAEGLENNPLLSIDYLKRAFLINGERKLLRKVNLIFKENDFDEHFSEYIEGFLNSN
ncbi:MAG: hypothetical protein KAR83_05995 [Thermodesulfovibrionales bacterium]|nr:hypothetical protein [Thermodesulfovibrionales bacterium]